MIMMIILYLLFHCFLFNTSHASDTILPNHMLSNNQTIVSSGGAYALGFFSPGNSSRYYLGIWQNKVTKPYLLWVANRNTPIADTNYAQLKISSGNIVLLNESKIKIWSTDVNPVSLNTSVFAVLLDNGNFVLRQSNSTLSNPLWQSFDNPTNAWFSGGKIGYNKITKRKQSLTSWKNHEDPAPGPFSLVFDPVAIQIDMWWNGSEKYWTTGPWVNNYFTEIPEMIQNHIYNFSFVDDENESYFTCELYNSTSTFIFYMDVSGQMRHYFWSDTMQEWHLFGTQPRQQCEVEAFCGPFGICNQVSSQFCSCLPGFELKSDDDWNLGDHSGGCVKKIDFECGSNGSSSISDGRRYRFSNSYNVRLPIHSLSVSVQSANECESTCLRNCSCTAYAYHDNECSLWTGALLSVQQLAEGDVSGRTISIKLDASSSIFPTTRRSRKALVVGTCVGAISFVFALAFILSMFWSCSIKVDGSTKGAGGNLVMFGFKDLQNATKNFSNKLGEGGFGSVFRGVLSDSTIVAVKKLEGISQGEKQFRAEVSTIGTIQHINLVRLHGFCSEGKIKMLVYEYMENGSLDSHLFNNDESKALKWETRYKIALGLARGLEYLHEKCRDCIIHCDIKPENILLDAQYCSKVADFGLAKILGRDFSRILTTMRGTRGYLAPEWISGEAITTKADVYSYGMVLLELVCGKRNYGHYTNAESEYFPARAARVITDGGDVLGLLDPLLNHVVDKDELSKICMVGCWCIQDDENIRPSMGQVVQMIEGVIDMNLPPMPHSLKEFDREAKEEPIFFFAESSVGSKSQAKTNTSASSFRSSGVASLTS